MTFEYAVVDALLIAERSIVFTGNVTRGEVCVGDNLSLHSPLGQVSVKVISLEPRGFRRAGARTGDNVAVVVGHVGLEPVADGYSHTADNQIHAQALTLHGRCV